MQRLDHNIGSPEDFCRALWPTAVHPTKDFATLEGDEHADVVVIGGGYTGLSSALHLAPDRRVILLEAQQPGFGASGRNAAGYLPAYLDQSPDDVVRSLGDDRGHALNRMVAGSTALMLRIIEKYGIDAELRHSGILMGAHNAASRRALMAMGAMWRRYGAKIATLEADETFALSGSRKFFGGLLFKEAGTINPVSYAHGLANAAATEGAGIFAHSVAKKIEREASRWRVRTDRGSVLAKHVLIATDAYPAAPELWPLLERNYYRLPVAMIASHKMPKRVSDFLPGGVPICDSHKTNHFWLMATPDGRLVASLLPPRHDEMTPGQVARVYEKKLRRIFGDFASIDWEYFWIGNVAVSARRIPCALRLAENVHSIGGYSGQGITAATAAGQEYAKFFAADCRETHCDLPFFDPKSVPLRAAAPKILRKIVAPLSHALDRSYA